MSKTFMVKIPMQISCWHPAQDPDEEPELVDMSIEICDPEVPSYRAICPKCGREVIFTFDPW